MGICNVAGIGTEKRSNTSYQNTLKTIKQFLVDEYGGYIRIRHENNTRYLDYVNQYGDISSQSIIFGVNLLNLTQKKDASDIVTVVIPTGKTVKDEQTGISAPLTIESVNNGKDYLVDTALAGQYGYIWKQLNFNQVEDPAVLKANGEAYLNSQNVLPNCITLNAVDLSLIYPEYEKFHFGDFIWVKSGSHDVNHSYLLSEQQIDILSPEKSKYVLGASVKTLTGITSSSNAKINNAMLKMAAKFSSEMEKAIEDATKLITGGFGGFVVYRFLEDGTPSEILIMDTPDIATATNVIRLNQNGIGFSTNGFDGPYETAWTIDGHFNADFITAGTLQAININGVTVNGSTVNGTNINGGTITASKITNGKFTVEPQGTVTLSGGYPTYLHLVEGSGWCFDLGGQYCNCLYDNGNAWVNGGATQIYKYLQGAYSTSDRRQKENIERIDIEVSKELILNAKTYSFNYDYDKKKLNFGVIAQEVEEQCDRLGVQKKNGLVFVPDDPDKDWYSVEYKQYVPHLINVIQDMQNQIDSLKRQINERSE